MVKHKELFGWATAAVANGATAVTQTHAVDEMLYTATLLVGLIAGIMSVVYTAYKWYKKATDPNSKGGTSITFDEIEDGIKEVSEVLKNVNKNK